MWKVPSKLVLTSGASVGKTPLTAFDKALLDAGIGNLNPVKVTSVVPPRAQVFRVSEHPISLPLGALVPTVYIRIFTDEPGTEVATAIAAGIPADNRYNGMIFEASVRSHRKEAERIAIAMVKEAFETRCVPLDKIVSSSTEIALEAEGLLACAISAVVLLP